MSNLYIRVMTGFYAHRKTAKLRALIGDDAFWVVPRLWAYAAENQPDGDMSGYSSDELSMLLACPKHAPSILEALKTSGYLDQDGKIHDWQVHNGYHKSYSERAKKAAEARWSKKKKGKGNRKEESGDKQCLEHACSIYDVYPLKVGKPAALKAIEKALKRSDFETLMAKTKEYAEIVGSDLQYVPNPSTWFNQDRWNDNEVARQKAGIKSGDLFQPKKHRFEGLTNDEIAALSAEERLKYLHWVQNHHE